MSVCARLPGLLAVLVVLLGLAAAPAAGQPRGSPIPPTAADLDPLALQLTELPPGRRLDRQILVTIADPHGARIDLRGRPGPRYQRRSDYRVSADVVRTARRLASDFGLETVDEWPIQPLGVYCLVYSVDADEDVEALLAALGERPEVESAQRLNVFQTQSVARMEYDDPHYRLQHALDTMQLPEAHVWSRGEGVNVAIVDTGADLRHPELRAQIAAHRDFVGDRGAAFSADRHGTALAGIIGAAANNGIGIVGVAPDARLHVLRACWHAARDAPALCTSFTLARALTHALESGVDVINLSLTGPSDPLLTRLLGVALSRDIGIVGAMAPPGSGGRFPSDVAGVIRVASSDGDASRPSVTSDDRPGEMSDDRPGVMSDNRHDRPGEMSDSRGGEANRGGKASGIENALHAPGHDIIVAAPDASFTLASGTSLSAAHVTGVVALLKARDPTLGVARLHALLAASRAAPPESVNACRALAALLERPACESAGPPVTLLRTHSE